MRHSCGCRSVTPHGGSFVTHAPQSRHTRACRGCVAESCMRCDATDAYAAAHLHCRIDRDARGKRGNDEVGRIGKHGLGAREWRC